MEEREQGRTVFITDRGVGVLYRPGKLKKSAAGVQQQCVIVPLFHERAGNVNRSAFLKQRRRSAESDSSADRFHSSMPGAISF